MTIRPVKILKRIAWIFGICILIFPLFLWWNFGSRFLPENKSFGLVFLFATSITAWILLLVGGTVCLVEEDPTWTIKFPSFRKHKKSDPVIEGKLEEIYNQIRLSDGHDLDQLIRQKELLESKL